MIPILKNWSAEMLRYCKAKYTEIMKIWTLLHELRELSHLLRLMKLALALKQSDYTAGLLQISGTSRDSNWSLHCWGYDCFASPSSNIVSFFWRSADLAVWNTEKLKLKNVEILKFCKAEIWKIWNTEEEKNWNTEMMIWC